VFAGHDHKGGYALDENGIHHVTLASPLEAVDCVAHAVAICGFVFFFKHSIDYALCVRVCVFFDAFTDDRQHHVPCLELIGNLALI